LLLGWVEGRHGAGREGGGDEDEAALQPVYWWASLGQTDNFLYSVGRKGRGPLMTTLQAGLKNQAHAGLEEAAFFFLLKKLGI